MLAPYLAFARAAFQRQLAYRVANWAGLFTNVFFLFFRAFALKACFQARDTIGGLDVVDVVTYATVTQALLMVCPQWGSTGLAASVRSGHVAVELLRPVDLVGSYLARRLAVSAYYAGFRMLPVLAVGAAAGLLAFRTPVATLVPFAFSVALGAWIAICIMIVVDLSSFWLESERGFRYLLMGSALLPSGLLIPLSFYPGWLQAIFALTPFPHTMYSATRIWLGQVAGVDLAVLLLTQLAWAAALTVLCRLTLRAGARRLQVLGG